ncbi:MAG: hypothetical protein LBG28_01370 [Tannerella sp.]|nr:hypothetical protein [Tannerella sp.]
MNDGYERVGKGIGYLFMMAVANLLYNLGYINRYIEFGEIKEEGSITNCVGYSETRG